MFIVQARKIAKAVNEHHYVKTLIHACVVTLAYSVIGAMFYTVRVRKSMIEHLHLTD